MSTGIQSLLEQIPSRTEIIQLGCENEVATILELLAKEFEAVHDTTDDSISMDKAQNNGNSWKWYVEIPFEVSKVVQHAVRDALAEKFFDAVYFNEYGSFVAGETRMSITVLKEDEK